jgi:hypothetical protein
MGSKLKSSRALPGLAVVAMLMAIAPNRLSADPLTFVNSGSTFTSANVGYGYYMADYGGGSSSLEYAYVEDGSTSVSQSFSFLVDLPSLADGTLVDASLNLSVSNPAGGYNVGDYWNDNYGSLGNYEYYGDFSSDCYFGCSENNYSAPTAYFSDGASATITSITDGTNTWNGSYASGTLDLVSLGFGEDLLSGGVLTISGTRDAFSDPGVFSSGFNGYNNYYSVSYSGSGSESGILTVDADQSAGVPEPATLSLMVIGLTALWKRRRRS